MSGADDEHVEIILEVQGARHGRKIAFSIGGARDVVEGNVR
jgi:hypothetical protein